MSNRLRLLAGTAIGASITPVAIGLAVASMGAGHGDYAIAKLLFPYSMLLTLLFNDTISYPLVALALVQFPLYGLAIVSQSVGRSAHLTAAACALLHAAFASLCFFGFLPNFS